MHDHTIAHMADAIELHTSMHKGIQKHLCTVKHISHLELNSGKITYWYYDTTSWVSCTSKCSWAMCLPTGLIDRLSLLHYGMFMRASNWWLIQITCKLVDLSTIQGMHTSLMANYPFISFHIIIFKMGNSWWGIVHCSPPLNRQLSTLWHDREHVMTRCQTKNILHESLSVTAVIRSSRCQTYRKTDVLLLHCGPFPVYFLPLTDFCRGPSKHMIYATASSQTLLCIMRQSHWRADLLPCDGNPIYLRVGDDLGDIYHDLDE